MKNIFLIFSLAFSTLFYAQKSENYLQVSYNSICCGTPSIDPVINFIEKFQKKNKGKKIEIFLQSGLGREGEFKLLIGTDMLSDTQKKNFVKCLQSVVNNQNKSRNVNRDGIVDLNNLETLKKENLSKIKNLTVYKKEI